MTKGDDFLAEAERLGAQEPEKFTLAYLQGTLMLYEKFASQIPRLSAPSSDLCQILSVWKRGLWIPHAPPGDQHWRVHGIGWSEWF
jgi:hypothetical protein